MSASAVAGIIFANVHDELMLGLTERRSMASLPFGGRYRLIDFPLSNLVNAGVTTIGLITKENYRSLLDHIGSGTHWDLDRKNGGLHLMPPYNYVGAKRQRSYVDSLYSAMNFVERSNADYIVTYNADIIANVDIADAVLSHVKNNADITIIYNHGILPENHTDLATLSIDDGIVNEISFEKSEGEVDFGLGIFVYSKEALKKIVERGYDHNDDSIYDSIRKAKDQFKIRAYNHKGFVAVMDSGKSYYEANMKLLDSNVRRDLFNKERPILTKTRDDMPTRYGTKSKVSNSFIADGCVIEGTVKNSVLFRGVTVEKGVVVENSILMQGTKIGANTKLDYVISDKNAVIGDEMTVKGNAEKPFLIQKNQTL